MADSGIKPNMSLLQGCPASMILLAALMVIWTKHARGQQQDNGDDTAASVVPRQERRMRFSVFVDDRAMWCRGTEAVNDMNTALSRAEEADANMGLEMRADRCNISKERKKVEASL